MVPHPASPIAFAQQPIFPTTAGITRRDPSPVIAVDGRYHVWYSRNVSTQMQPKDGFTATIWHASSPDGWIWHEHGEAIGRGGLDAFDGCGVYTPTTLIAEGRYWLFYTAMPRAWLDDRQGTCGAIGVAWSDSPFGPWRTSADPVLRCADNPAAFDSLRVDDTCIVVRNGAYWMYYKGRQVGRPWTTTQMGLAVATHPLGPWRRHPGNPVLDSGHEVCVWPHGCGVACLVSEVGPQGNTLQYSDDGIRFRRLAPVVPPKAPGPFRADAYRAGHGPGITWGIAMRDDRDWPYLVRFDTDLTRLPGLD